MTDQLLNILKIAFLVLLYMFFVRVLWVVSSEVRATRAGGPAANFAAPTGLAADPTVPSGASGAGPVAAPPAKRVPKGRRGAVGRLVIVEPRSRRGSSYAVGPEITLGRSAGCTVQITDDTFISTLHARVFVDRHGVLVVEDLDSTNGTYLNGERLNEPRPVRRGDRLQVGSTVLEAQ